jgi:glycogen phosphorylase
MPKVRSFRVLPSLPESLKQLRNLASNMYWSWNTEFVELFRRIDPVLWQECDHNPVKLLGSVSQARLEDLAANEGFLYQLNCAVEKFGVELNAPSWFDRIYKGDKKNVIAYFSAEFGVHECLPIYSGGLGILAGDHLKSASDLGLPMVGIGLLYQNGYFRQYLNADGWQQEHYVENDFYNMPLELVREADGSAMTVRIPIGELDVIAQVWKVQVGRVPLYLLDTNIADNRNEDRDITSVLYGGDLEMRIRQEIVLGIGGYNTLVGLGIQPDVCHMNEGHAAFMSLERVRHLKDELGLSFDEAVQASRGSNIFTVHTPVPAGNDEFPAQLMKQYLGRYCKLLNIDEKKFLGMGRLNASDDKEHFKMPVLAIRMSVDRNGVSELHGEVSRQMWSGLWPELPPNEIPIDSVTNGIHMKSWLSAEVDSLFERYLGANWNDESVDKSIWQNIDQVPDEELWRIHQTCKERLISYVRGAIKAQMKRRGAYRAELSWADEVLDPTAFTIGFARRFATYKRGALLFSDIERVTKLFTDPERPVQIIFAGKAHPKDNAGKEIIRKIVHFANQSNVRRRVVFLEDYNIDVARYMVQGVDVWLNNPRRPMEASGTSGMKAAMNGIMNVSTLDGWWCEGYQPDGGWVIGAGESYDDLNYQDRVESASMYRLLENEVVPLFYERGADRLPREWVKRMKNTIKYIAPRFNTHRMLADYTRKFYSPSMKRWKELTDGNMAKAKGLSAWLNQMQQHWSEVEVLNVWAGLEGESMEDDFAVSQPHLQVGSRLNVEAEVKLGQIKPEDVNVEVFFGEVDSWGNIKDGKATSMVCEESKGKNNVYRFKGSLVCEGSGQHGFAVRVLPKHADLANPCDTGLIAWENHQAEETEPEDAVEQEPAAS